MSTGPFVRNSTRLIRRTRDGLRHSGTLAAPEAASRTGAPASPAIPERAFANGLGGFVNDGQAYAVVLEAGRQTPAPWANILANPHFGTIVTESGAAHTWSDNSRENRLTSFTADPVVDPTAEALFIRDDESGDAWTPTPGPMPRGAASGPCLVQHEAGRTHFSRVTRDIHHELDVFVDVEAPVRYALLALTNAGTKTRRLSLLSYNDWVLGPPREDQQNQVVTTLDPESGAIFARNVFNDEYRGHIAFSYSSERPRFVSGSRRSFIGRNGSLAAPDALRHLSLDGQIGAGLDPCAALQVECELQPGERREVLFLLGQGRDALMCGSCSSITVRSTPRRAAMERVRSAWGCSLERIQVHTPDDSFDVLLNQWLLYQDISCRLWTRAGYYQPGGAFGFRDQLQDVHGAPPREAGPRTSASAEGGRPSIHRRRRAALVARTERQGPPVALLRRSALASVRGRRVRANDGRRGRARRACAVSRSGAAGARRAGVLRPAQRVEPRRFRLRALLRAIDKGSTVGQHGLPLFGSWDWNDGMNRVGPDGRRRKHLARVLPLQRADRTSFRSATRAATVPRAVRYRNEARRLAGKLELAVGRGMVPARLLRRRLAARLVQNDECRIDSIAQTWAVLSKAVPVRFAERAMDAVRASLVMRGPQLALLLHAALRSLDAGTRATSRGTRQAFARTVGSTPTRPCGWSWRSRSSDAETKPPSSSTC